MADTSQVNVVEEKYQKRIQQLENETFILLQEFESLQRENELLRNKYETTIGGDIITEPYDVVNAERINLRSKVEKYKTKLNDMEIDRINVFTKIKQENKRLTQKIENLERDRDRQEQKIRKLEGKLKSYDEGGLRVSTVMADPLLPVMKAVKTGYKYKPNFKTSVQSALDKSFSSPLPSIGPQTNSSSPLPSYAKTDYVSLYKKRLNMM